MRLPSQSSKQSPAGEMFAYVVDILRRAGLTDLRSEASKYPILVAINLVNCIATARRATP